MNNNQRRTAYIHCPGKEKKSEADGDREEGEWVTRASNSLWYCAAALADLSAFLCCVIRVFFMNIPITRVFNVRRCCVSVSIILLLVVHFRVFSRHLIRLLCDSVVLPRAWAGSCVCSTGVCALVSISTQFIYFMSCNRNRFVWQSHGNRIISMIFITLPQYLFGFVLIQSSTAKTVSVARYTRTYSRSFCVGWPVRARPFSNHDVIC